MKPLIRLKIRLSFNYLLLCFTLKTNNKQINKQHNIIN